MAALSGTAQNRASRRVSPAARRSCRCAGDYVVPRGAGADRGGVAEDALEHTGSRPTSCDVARTPNGRLRMITSALVGPRQSWAGARPAPPDGRADAVYAGLIAPLCRRRNAGRRRPRLSAHGDPPRGAGSGPGPLVSSRWIILVDARRAPPRPRLAQVRRGRRRARISSLRVRPRARSVRRGDGPAPLGAAARAVVRGAPIALGLAGRRLGARGRSSDAS